MSSEETYSSLFPAIFRYFYYRVQVKEESEDMAQESFFRFFRKYDPLSLQPEEIRKIIYRIASLVYKERLRNLVHTSDYELTEDFPFPEQYEELEDETSEDYLAEKLPLLMEAIETLNPTLRDVITLRFIEGLTRKEVAERLGTKEKYVHIYQQRAIKALQKLVQP